MELVSQDKKELLEYEKALREKYNPDNIFKNQEEKAIPIQDEQMMHQTEMIKYKESMFKRIKNWFKGLFGRR